MLFMATIMFTKQQSFLTMLALELPGILNLLKGSELQLRLKLELQAFLTSLHLVQRSAEIRDGVDVMKATVKIPRLCKQCMRLYLAYKGRYQPSLKKGVPFVAGNKRVAACAKHFVGDGGTMKGINENNTVINKHGLLSIHMPGYYDSIIKGVATIMVSSSSWNRVKMHANRDLITGFLKNALRFTGFVISEWEGIDRITSPPHANYSYSIQAGISAGIDMVMVPYKYTEFINDLTFLVKNGIIPISRIDDAVKRILRVKFVMGLFEEPLADLSFINQLGSQEHRELSREAVRRSLVLLKNGESADKPLLPLPKKA